MPADPGGAGAPTTADRVTALTLVLVSAAATTTAVVHRFASIGRAGLLALAFVALAFAVGVGRWRRALGMRTVLVLTVGLLAVAVTYWPRDSTDIWSYAAYGRMMSHYGASPYRHVPVEYSNDRAVRRVGPVWQNTSSVYGPLWNGISAGVVALANTDAHSTRTLFQGLAALSVFLAALLVARRTRAPAAVALIGLNPLVIYDIVNGGHNDALVGLAILVGVLLATRERFVLAAVAIALGALVKLVALLALAALIVWVWRRRGSRPALASGAAAGGVVALGYAVSGGLDALKPLQDARLQMSRNSIWLLTSSDGRARLFGLDRALLSPDFLRPVATISMITVLLLAAVLVASRLRDRTPTLVVGSALVAYLLASMYVLPWYAAWALPVLMLEWRSGLTRLVLAQSALYLVAYQYRQSFPATLPYQALFVANVALVLFELTIIIALLVVIVRQRRPQGARVGAATPGAPVAARLD
ncbi:MAG TPA: glycosyltransferase 87 family protein [Acidimicrobiia bacterium]|nr:glycosyltransferase 87 family protein [Acidimicrobiia bacterium]